MNRSERNKIIQKLVKRLGVSKGRSNTGINAAIRRLDLNHPGASILSIYQSLDEAGLDFDKTDPLTLKCWLLVAHTLALAQWRHHEQVPIGKGLVAMHYGENRLKQLLSADYEVLEELLPRIGRRFAGCTSVVGMDFLPLVDLAFGAGFERAGFAGSVLEDARLSIAQSFTREQGMDKRNAS